MHNFLELAQQARQNPADADFTALRQSYLVSDNYRPTSHFSANKLMGNTNGLTDFAEVIEFCEKILDSNSMDLEVWMLLAFAAEKTEQPDLAKRAHTFIRGMLDALFATGDGQSFETAYQVIAIVEEYTVFSVQGLKSRRQALAGVDERRFDVWTCQPRGAIEDEDMKEIYFDITAPFRYMQDTLGNE